LTYIIQPAAITTKRGEEIATSRVSWGTQLIDETADQAMVEDKDPTATDAAIEFLTLVLADGPMPVAEIEIQARAARVLGQDKDISQSKPFRDARRRLGIVSRKAGLLGGWSWALPAPKMP
jgi:hypothetical protein